MNNSIATLESIIDEYEPRLKRLSENTFAAKPFPDKWSGKEILGHLVDSAQNNIRRFVVSQYEEMPRIVYDQDKWVAISDYAHATTEDLIRLWALLNRHICGILKNTAPDKQQSLCYTSDPEPHTISWLATDYKKHLLHHLHQVLEMEPVPYP